MNNELTSQLDLLAPLLSRPWAISQRHFSSFQASMRAIVAQSPEGFFELSDFITPRPGASIDDQGHATIHIKGALADKAPPIWEKLGNTDYRSIRAELDGIRSAGAQSLTLAVDTPGGSVAGLAETAADISATAEQMPVHGACDGMACSAGYWLVSSADTISATPSTEMGNIGVVLVHVDDTKFLEAIGVEVNVMTNEGADLKGTFREPLSESQAAFVQQSLDETGAAFRAQVEGNREGIDPEVFRAGWYSGSAALALGLIDSIA